ncbi:hypothetical protein [Paenibacillus sp.]|jgi:hypothetical protein|uniref:hypothetical protein n=1 Tax=Paenibacillus sp. TaxID=58172 RepID=UPI0028229B0C|nr:hypothetical protein [Paenibacillus sp.]MDR0269586.1 hypothetical protein [Paenibacillus sp.]
MKKMIAVSILALAVVGVSLFPATIQAFGTYPGIDPTKGGSGGHDCHNPLDSCGGGN